MPKNHCIEMTALFSKSGNAVHFLLFLSSGIFCFLNQYNLIIISTLREHFLVKYYISILKLVKPILPFCCSVVNL